MVLLNIALFVFAYDGDTKAKEWKAKYFDLEQKANEQFDHANKYALEKYNLQEQLAEIEARTAETNKILEDTRKELDAMSKDFEDQRVKLEQKTKELETNKQISNLPFSCPPIVQPPKKKIVKRKKRIPYDIAPSQQ